MTADAFFSRLNPLFSWLLRSPLHPLLSPAMILITVTGRRSGRRYTLPVGYQCDGDRLWVMVSEARRKTWWRNYREPWPIEVLLRGRERVGRGEVVPSSSEEFRGVAEQILRRIPRLGRAFGIDYKRREGLTEAQLEQLCDEIVVVRVTLENAQALRLPA